MSNTHANSSASANGESPWRDRLSALRNLPPVLRIVWNSGPAVVLCGFILRILVATVPFAIAKVAQYIITDIAAHLRGQSLPSAFWELVAAEVILNVVFGLLSRCIDYSDALLANRYTQYVSVRVMEQASRLDLTTYENPLFHDRLERARVQATDRLIMIQQVGRLFSAEHYDGRLFCRIGVGVSVAGATASVRGIAVFSRRDPLCLPGIRQELSPDNAEAPDGIPA